MDIQIQKGWNLEQADSAAELYEEAVGAKFTRAIPDKLKRIAILSKSFVPVFSFAATLEMTLSE